MSTEDTKEREMIKQLDDDVVGPFEDGSSFERDGFLVEVHHAITSAKADSYLRYISKDRLEAFKRGEWHLYTLSVDVYRPGVSVKLGTASFDNQKSDTRAYWASRIVRNLADKAIGNAKKALRDLGCIESQFRLEYHQDTDWRLCEGADDHWMGLVVETSSDQEVCSFQELACVDYAKAKHLASCFVLDVR